MTDAIILAAGKSTRFGTQNKLLTRIYSKPLIFHLVNEICKSKADNIFVVTGKDHLKINEVLRKFRVKVLKNTNYHLGINSSISFGINALDKKSNSVMICLADMPLLKSEDYDNLLHFENEMGGKSKIILPYNGKQTGNPVVFGRKYYSKLLSLEGDEGGKTIIYQNQNNIVKFFSNFKGYFFDIDFQTDVLKLAPD